MERVTAVKKITQILGTKKWGFVVNKGAPGAEKRTEAYQLFKKAAANRDELGKAMQARSDELLAADPTYQKIAADYKASREAAEHLGGLARHYKFEVGQDRGLFFHVHAQGDSWEEIIETLQKKKKGGDLIL